MHLDIIISNKNVIVSKFTIPDTDGDTNFNPDTWKSIIWTENRNVQSVKINLANLNNFLIEE